MSKLIATIKKIQNVENLNIVTFDFNSTLLKMMSLDLSKDIEVGKKVSLNIKPTFVAIGKNFSGELSYSNKINSIIDSIEYGELLCSIKLSSAESIFESIITVESASRMNLKVGDEVIALIKASELSISEILQ